MEKINRGAGGFRQCLWFDPPSRCTQLSIFVMPHHPTVLTGASYAVHVRTGQVVVGEIPCFLGRDLVGNTSSVCLAPDFI